MKKLLLLAAATAALSTSAFADEGIADISKTGFYVRADGGVFWNTTQKFGVNDQIKLKSKAAPSLDLGVGFNINEQFRAEVVYTHLFDPESKASKVRNRNGYSSNYNKSESKS